MPSVSTVNPDAPALLVQLSDSHLFADADGKLLGMNTHDSLQRVIERVLDEQPQVDLILASGDLSQDGSLASYQRFRQLQHRTGERIAGTLPVIHRFIHHHIKNVRLAAVKRSLLTVHGR